MARAGPLIALAVAALTAACAGKDPPPELSGLWSAGDAACEAGVGVRFEADRIAVVYDDQAETLFKSPRYEMLAGDNFRVRITYELPRITGGARSVGAHGVLILARTPVGGIAPETHNLMDGLTGAARIRIANDPAVTALTLQPCGAHPWRGNLRGLTRT